MILCGSVFANSAVELSDGTFLKSSDYIPYPGRNKSSNNGHLMRIYKKLIKARQKLIKKCEDRIFTSSNLNELINLNNDMLKIVNLKHPDGEPIVGRFNSDIIIQIISNPLANDKDLWRNCGVDIKNTYQR